MFRGGYHVNALFNNVQDLKVGDRVKMAGVEIGRVERIQLTNNKVLVTMKVRPKEPTLRPTASPRSNSPGLMGQNFVSIDFGTPGAPPAVKDDQCIATAEQPDLSAIMAKMDNVASGVENLTKSFTGVKIDNLVGPLSDFMKQNRGPLTATISNITICNISTQMPQGKGTLGKLIKDDTLYNSALATVTNLQDTAVEVRRRSPTPARSWIRSTPARAPSASW